MSADRWSFCPRCSQIALENLCCFDREVRQAYGNVLEQEYRVLLQEYQQQPIALEPTLREDYEIFMTDEGKFCVSYCCHCEICDFSYQFKESKQIPIKEKNNED